MFNFSPIPVFFNIFHYKTHYYSPLLSQLQVKLTWQNWNKLKNTEIGHLCFIILTHYSHNLQAVEFCAKHTLCQ